MPRETKNKPVEAQATPLNLPESCLACRTLNVASFTVKLTQLDGSVITVCYVARCFHCGYIKNYGMRKGIYKLTGRVPDFNLQYWPELQRNGITPAAFVEAVCEASRDPRPIWLDARRGLKQAEAEGDGRQWQARLERLVYGRRAF